MNSQPQETRPDESGMSAVGGPYDYLFAKKMRILFFVVLSLIGGFCSAADTQIGKSTRLNSSH